ncbi:MAG: hypothetical protein IJ428_00640 [Clostridia bacterium]|nr:hypothetical protein [Clostridia bacterium]
MKKRVIAILLVVLCLAAVGCGRFVNGSETSEKQSADTGYLSGEIQRALVYYNGCVYGYDFYDYLQDGQILTDELPEGFEYSGSTEGEDPNRIPYEELTTAQMSDGCEIYSSTATFSVIYVKYPAESDYRRFIDVTDWVEEQNK